jgi:uncharacterized protein YgbK (DUF1537 family)
MPESQGCTLVLAGSCSAATCGQIERVREAWPCLKIDVEALAQGQNLVDSILAWFGELDGSMPALIYSSADPAEITRLQERFGRDQVGGMVEGLFAEIARKLAPHVGRLIVAGGETSGAVVSALGIRAIRIGPEIAPGVPWTESLGEPRMALALKSGNFGGPDFFEDALSM